jgi:hypothetical protein
MQVIGCCNLAATSCIVVSAELATARAVCPASCPADLYAALLLRRGRYGPWSWPGRHPLNSRFSGTGETACSHRPPLALPCDRGPPPRQPRREARLMRCLPHAPNQEPELIVFRGTSLCEQLHCIANQAKRQIVPLAKAVRFAPPPCQVDARRNPSIIASRRWRKDPPNGEVCATMTVRDDCAQSEVAVLDARVRRSSSNRPVVQAPAGQDRPPGVFQSG